MSDAQARLEAIFKDLAVRSPNALTQAEQLRFAKTLWDELHPATRRGGDRRSQKFRALDQSEVISFCKYAAKSIGCSHRSVELSVRLADDLGADLIAQLHSTPLAGSLAHLRRIADLDDRDRAAVLARMAAEKLSLRKALIAAGILRELDAEEASFLRIAQLLDAASARTRRRIFDHLQKKLSARPVKVA